MNSNGRVSHCYFCGIKTHAQARFTIGFAQGIGIIYYDFLVFEVNKFQSCIQRVAERTILLSSFVFGMTESLKILYWTEKSDSNLKSLSPE